MTVLPPDAEAAVTWLGFETVNVCTPPAKHVTVGVMLAKLKLAAEG